MDADDPETARSPKADLIVEKDVGPDQSSFSSDQQRVLDDTESVVAKSLQRGDPTTWRKARTIVEGFRPVPWFIWRLNQYVLGRSNQIGKVSEGMTLGLRRLLFAAASDPFLGSGEKVNSVRKALGILAPDVVAAIAVIHSISRRLASNQFERIWRPMLEDAIVRAQIGFLVSEAKLNFGAGRGMLAGFSGRSGLAVMIATGTQEQAQEGLELLSSGSEINSVGLKVYGCEPVQVSALILSAVGCGSDSAFGIGAFSEGKNTFGSTFGPQRSWLACFTLVEALRAKRSDFVSDEVWDELNISDSTVRKNIVTQSVQIARRGHTLTWLE